MTTSASHNAVRYRDFDDNAYGRFGEVWRWRVYGYAIFIASAVLSSQFYAHIGLAFIHGF